MGFGLMDLTYSYGEPVDEEHNMAILDKAFELGCTFWDTAE
jgi:aryl-alcohol dehydrogenase-like predicted oxidoreductase